MTKLKNLNCDPTQKLKLWQISNSQIVTKLKLWQNSNCKKKKKKNSIVTKLKKANCDKTTIYDKTQFVTTLNWWQNFKRVFQTEILDTLTTDEMFSGQLFAISRWFQPNVSRLIIMTKTLKLKKKYSQKGRSFWAKKERSLYSITLLSIIIILKYCPAPAAVTAVYVTLRLPP